MNERRIIALLGRRDEPTDAVEEYCRYLSDALRPHGFAMQLERLAWNEQGWPTALRELRQKAGGWRGSTVLLQYTALAWSRHGFPPRFLKVIKAAADAGAHVGIVFHDGEPYGGTRVVDRIRSLVQRRTMRRALRRACLAVFTTPLETIRWLGNPPSNATFIPVGANFLAAECKAAEQKPIAKSRVLRVAVFGITGGKSGDWEAAQIVQAVHFAASQLGRLELCAFGRGAAESEAALRDGLRTAPVDVQVMGILPSDQVAHALSSSDVMLFVRASISTRRGSAIAGIACGLPLVGYKGHDTVAPVTEGGLVLVPRGSPELGKALLQVLSNNHYREQLAEASRYAQQKYFSWAAIAARYAEELQRTP
jgi:glycosyltransferase involved in cell wall biosynthesis